MVAVGSGVSVEKIGMGVALNTSNAVQEVNNVVAMATARHMRRTAFPGTARQGRCVAVQVSNPRICWRLLRRGERPPRNDISLRNDVSLIIYV